MTRLVGEHFNPEGKPKRRYVNKPAAQAQARRLGKKVYKCGVCHYFHIGGKGKKSTDSKVAPWRGDPKEVKRCEEAGRQYGNYYAALQASQHYGGEPYECPVQSCGGWHLRPNGESS